MFKVDSATNLTLRTIDTDTTLVANNDPTANSQSPNVQSTSSCASSNRDRLSAPVIQETEPETIEIENTEVQIESKQESYSWTKRFDDIRVFTFFMCVIVMLTNALIVGYRNSVVTTIEKRYEFSSVFSGILSGCLEFGSLITTLFVSYFCSKSHIPRCIAIGSLFCGIGALLYALPHALWSGGRVVSSVVSNSSINEHRDELLCRHRGGAGPVIRNSPINGDADAVISSILNTLDLNSACLQKPSNLSHFILLIIANILIGSSSAPLYTLGTSYIDNHVEKDNSSVYLAFIYSMLAFGPLVGYLVGAWFLRFYVDGFVQNLSIDPSHSSWVGAWYAGFILFGVLIFITAFPFFCFPRTIKKNNRPQEVEEEKLKIQSATTNTLEENFGDLKNLPRAIKRILSNRVFMIVTLGFCFEITIISGFMTFLPKYIEHQFDVDNSLANIYTGGIAIPGACFGIVCGGFIVKRLKINPKSASLMAIICNIICLTGIVVLVFMGCDNIKMAGTTSQYTSKPAPHVHPSGFNLTSRCNAECQCSTVSIDPVCGINGLTYFSPCHAGCRTGKKSNHSNRVIYSSCSCVRQDLHSEPSDFGEASSGSCQPGNPCGTLLPFLIILFFITFLTALNQMPMIMVTLRSVSEIERAFALGLQLVIMRLLAYIPSPLIFGQAIDWTCVIWRRDECDKTGSCLFYDREKFRHVYGSIAAVYKSISLVLFVLLFVTVRTHGCKFTKPVEMAAMMGSITSLNSAHRQSQNKKKPRLRLKTNKKRALVNSSDSPNQPKEMHEINKMIVI